MANPKKPDRPLAVLLFSKDGKVRKSVEHLPQSMKDLELAIADKLVGSLDRFHHQKIARVIPAEDQGDFILLDHNGSVIRVQLTEVVDQVCRQLEQQRRTYPKGLEAEFPEVIDSLAGCRLIITDNGCAPFLPPVRSKAGRQCLKELATALLDLEAHSVTEGRRRIRRHQIGPDKVLVILDCERHLPATTAGMLGIFWSGGRLSVGDESVSILADAITKKINQNYAKPTEPFWLVLYSRDFIATRDSKEFQMATSVLSQGRHPFDEVWFLYPYPDEALGSLTRLWPWV